MTTSTAGLPPYGSSTPWFKGECYEKNSWAQYALAEEVVRIYTFHGAEAVLDLGSGDGKIASLIAREKVPKGNVTGLDISPSMHSTAQQHHGDISNLTFVLGDMQKFELQMPFDVIVSFSALHWCPDQAAVWSNIRKHLKVGGTALISLNPWPRQQEFQEAIECVSMRPLWRSYLEDYKEESTIPEISISEYQQIVVDAGLEVALCTSSVRHMEFDHRESLVNSVLAWLPHAAQVPEESQRPFVEEIIDLFLENTLQKPTGRVILKYTNYRIQASRPH